MISNKAALLSGAALSLILPFTPAGAETAWPGAFTVAQVEGEAPTTETPTVEVDPVAEAEKAVEDARAALREAMATGGDVRGARRALRAAIDNLNQVLAAAGKPPVEEGGSDVEAGTTPPDAASAETPPPTEPPPEAPAATAVPTEPPAELPILAEPPPPPSDQPPPGPMLVAPEPLAPQLALPPPPVVTETPPPPPVIDVPPPPVVTETPPPVVTEAPPPPVVIEPPPPPVVLEAPPPAVVPETPPPAVTEAPIPEPAPQEAEKEEEPGFFKRLFGGGKEKPKTEDVAAPPADVPPETPAETAKTDEPVLPIFKELPPLEGPKIVTVAPEGGEVVKQEDEKRVIVREGDKVTIKHDDNDRFRRKGEAVSVEKGKGGTTITTVERKDGTQVVTVRAASGDILQRYRKKKNGEIEVLIGERDRDGRPRQGDGPGPRRDDDVDFFKILPQLVIQIPQQQYVVGSQGASRSQIEAALIAPPVEAIERPYSLDEIRGSERLRAKLRRIDVDTVNFETGAATIREDQIPNLQAIGNALAAIIDDDPNEVFLIEGHTDAVGSDFTNLALSDRRAESIAEILSYYFNIPPENLVTQGYGEQYLKVLTAGPERQNRRGSVRRITPLLVGQL